MYKYCIDNLSPLKRYGLNRGLFLEVKMCKYFIDNLSPLKRYGQNMGAIS